MAAELVHVAAFAVEVQLAPRLQVEPPLQLQQPVLQVVDLQALARHRDREVVQQVDVGGVEVALASGEVVHARAVFGADGSGGRSGGTSTVRAAGSEPIFRWLSVSVKSVLLLSVSMQTPFV